MSLTDLQVRNAKPNERIYKLFDGKGLFLLVKPNGSKLWRLAYWFKGKQNTLALGIYPEVPLAGSYTTVKGEQEWIDGARELAAQARRTLARGIDPAEERKALKAAILEQKQQEAQDQARQEASFAVVAKEWFDRFMTRRDKRHAETTWNRLAKDALPALGDRPISEITAPAVLAMLRRIEARGALETAHRVRAICGQVFRYAIATGRAARDPAADIRGALPPPQVTHHAALIEPAEVGKLLRSIDAYQGTAVVKAALRFAPVVFVRPGELRRAEWVEMDLDKAEWTIPAAKMKMKAVHTVPLSRQAVGILRELQPITGVGRYVFPSVRSWERPMSENTVNVCIRTMGFPKETMTGHGFRAMARTILDEVLHFRVDIIEHQLAHAVRDANGRAYNRTQHLEERRRMMQTWADYLDELKGKGSHD
jgi:integrase